jgi:hypothetical protein
MERFKKLKKDLSLMVFGAVFIRENHKIWVLPAGAYPYPVITPELSRRKFGDKNCCYGVVSIKLLFLTLFRSDIFHGYFCSDLHPFLLSQISFRPSINKIFNEVLTNENRPI